MGGAQYPPRTVAVAQPCNAASKNAPAHGLDRLLMACMMTQPVAVAQPSVRQAATFSARRSAMHLSICSFSLDVMQNMAKWAQRLSTT